MCDGVMFCNAVFKKRTVGMGVIDPAWLEPYGVTGPNARAAGVAYLVVGVVVVEVVFVYPGMGQYMVDAVTVRDMPVVQACGLIFAAVYILLNMLADIIAIVANPRLRHPR